MVKSHKESNPAIKIYLRADQETEHRHVRKVMNAMGESGVDDFIFGAFIPSN
jgi:biopolymer transport protein ExbD